MWLCNQPYFSLETKQKVLIKSVAVQSTCGNILSVIISELNQTHKLIQPCFATTIIKWGSANSPTPSHGKFSEDIHYGHSPSKAFLSLYFFHRITPFVHHSRSTIVYELFPIFRFLFLNINRIGLFSI